MDAIDLAIIGGTGVYRLASLEDAQAIEGETPYGVPSGPVRVGRLAGRRVAFLAGVELSALHRERKGLEEAFLALVNGGGDTHGNETGNASGGESR